MAALTNEGESLDPAVDKPKVKTPFQAFIRTAVAISEKDALKESTAAEALGRAYADDQNGDHSNGIRRFELARARREATNELISIAVGYNSGLYIPQAD